MTSEIPSIIQPTYKYYFQESTHCNNSLHSKVCISIDCEEDVFMTIKNSKIKIKVLFESK